MASDHDAAACHRDGCSCACVGCQGPPPHQIEPLRSPRKPAQRSAPVAAGDWYRCLEGHNHRALTAAIECDYGEKRQGTTGTGARCLFELDTGTNLPGPVCGKQVTRAFAPGLLNKDPDQYLACDDHEPTGFYNVRRVSPKQAAHMRRKGAL